MQDEGNGLLSVRFRCQLLCSMQMESCLLDSLGTWLPKIAREFGGGTEQIFQAQALRLDLQIWRLKLRLLLRIPPDRVYPLSSWNTFLEWIQPKDISSRAFLRGFYHFFSLTSSLYCVYDSHLCAFSVYAVLHNHITKMPEPKQTSSELNDGEIFYMRY